MLVCLRFLSVFFILCCLSSVAPAGHGPTISFDRVKHDFGEVIHGSSPVASFQVTNIGDEPLSYSQLKMNGVEGASISSTSASFIVMRRRPFNSDFSTIPSTRAHCPLPNLV